MTDVIRCNLLQYSSYKTQMVEFVGFEHTPKNILIRAKKTKITKKDKVNFLEQVESLQKEFNLKTTLYDLLINKDWKEDKYDKYSVIPSRNTTKYR